MQRSCAEKYTDINESIGASSERILVVQRKFFFPNEISWLGLKPESMSSFLSIVKMYHEFLPRGIMEVDTTYKQIIPYLVFKHKDRYFLMQRRENASEVRLQNKFSLGIGGHIRQEDMTNDSVVTWARREFHEEVEYSGNFNIEPIGVLNDDTSFVGKVHLGFVFLLHGDSDKISIKSELKSGRLVTLEECSNIFKELESWSQIVLSFLENRKI